MKKTLKIIFVIFCIAIILFTGFIIYAISITSNSKLDTNKLINLNRTTAFYDSENNLMAEISNGTVVTEIDQINEHTLHAFIAIEDKRFYSHKGIDFRRLLSATVNNIKSASFKEGASTISQQLIKNTHFTNEKTIKRKLSEIKLALELERMFTKNQILEKYLNTIYFGENCYGITNAAKKYFNKDVGNLTLNESAVLAGVIKAPSNYSPFENPEKCLKRMNLVLNAMLSQNYINKLEYNQNINKLPNLSSENNQQNNIEYDYLYFAKKQLKEFHSKSPYAALSNEVYTNCDNNAQNLLKKILTDSKNNYLKSAILIDKNSRICAYYSNCGDINRQLGSTIKPIIAYAPAIEEDLVYPYTHITDEKTDFNGYSPKNYNNKYYGKTTVKTSLEKSMNVCAVKLLNYVGVDKALDYAKKTNLSFSENDKGLCLALGATEKGEKLSNICSAYTIFVNKGVFTPITSINTIKNNNYIKKHKQKKTKVFSFETTSFLNEMLRSTVSNGTAKKLSFLNFPVYAKTGTVGNSNGNTDAYTISYNNEYILGCWIGSTQNNLLPNTVTGGNLPTEISKKIWESLYENKATPEEIELSSNLIEVDIDKLSYENDNKIELTDSNFPKRYCERILIKKTNLPKIYSKRFSSPKIKMPKLSVYFNRIVIELCLTELYGVEIYRQENKKKILITDTTENFYTDNSILPNKEYQYSFIPYYKTKEDKKIYGNEIILDKIKSPSSSLDENWWNEID